MRILFKNAEIVTMNPNHDIVQGDLLVDGSFIAQMGGEINETADKVIDLHGDVIIPGLVQTHVHLCQTLFRGQGDDLQLMDWLRDRIWPLEGAHDPESIYYSALLGIGELFSGGTTTIGDMETVHHTEYAFQAMLESGIRAVAGKVMMDRPDEIPDSLQETTADALQKSADLFEKYHGRENGRLQVAFTPRFVISCTEDLLKEIVSFSQQKKALVHTHASENKEEINIVEQTRGMRNVLYLDKLGLTGPRLLLAHCIWLNEKEKDVLVETKTKICHCPSSNLKLASGFAPIPELLERGACVSLGADGAPCNNNLDGFREMRHAALIHKPFYGATVMPAEQVFQMATYDGACALGLNDQIGSLEKGKKADLAVIKLSGLHTWPHERVNLYSQLVYQATAHDVWLTMVDGKIVMEERKLLTIDEELIRIKSAQSLNRVLARAHVI